MREEAWADFQMSEDGIWLSSAGWIRKQYTEKEKEVMGGCGGLRSVDGVQMKRS